jgi:hypothetical protein
MRTPEYPTDIHTEDGVERIHRGHGLNRDVLLADVRHAHGANVVDMRVQEVHLRYQARVKNCGDYGDPCDFEGFWHSHWHEVRRNEDPEMKFTMVRPLFLPAQEGGER